MEGFFFVEVMVNGHRKNSIDTWAAGSLREVCTRTSLLVQSRDEPCVCRVEQSLIVTILLDVTLAAEPASESHDFH